MRARLEPKKEEAEKISEEISAFELMLKNDSFAKAKLEKIEEYDEEIRTLKPQVELYESSKRSIQEYENSQIERRYLEAKNTAKLKKEYIKQKEGLKSKLSTLEEETRQTREELDRKKGVYEENKTIVEELKTLREQLARAHVKCN